MREKPGLSHAAWAAAVAVAAVPTWQEWQPRPEPTGLFFSYGPCYFSPPTSREALVSAAHDLLGDAAEFALLRAVPVMLVVLGLLWWLRQEDPAAGQRVAWGLTLIAAAGFCVAEYRMEPCDVLSPLGLDWMGNQGYYLVAALLVLAGSSRGRALSRATR
ncbi:hypothetical protein ACTMTF_18475 [Nonomuraea sp. ZG12]|uniref:hypothetical protein n=1 Tax=Nonomuraea sp. ZG12 TaxID=3452207 RepID=UPI003F8B5A2E